MIKEILFTIFPTLIIIILLAMLIKIVTTYGVRNILKSFGIGLIIIIPALFTMKIVGIMLTITLSITPPLIMFRILSALNEELYKYWAIKVRGNINSTITGLFVGAGFALSETLYLTLGEDLNALHRSYTTLPLHIITAIILSLSIKYKRKSITILAVLVHLIYNLRP